MANYLVQHLKELPKDMQFRVIKTKMEVLWGDGVEVCDDRFNPLYFGTRKKANSARADLVKESQEPIFGVFSFVYLDDQEVTQWLVANGRMAGSEESPAIWFDRQEDDQKAKFRIEFVQAQAQAKLDLERAKAGNQTTASSPSEPVRMPYQPKWEFLQFLDDLPTVAAAMDRYYKNDRLNHPSGTRERLIANREADVAIAGYCCIACHHDSTNGLGIYIRKTDKGFHVFGS